MKNLFKNTKLKWILFSLAFAVVGYFLYEINNLIIQLRIEEQKKIELWANAINRKADLVEHTEKFFSEVREEERRRLEQFIEAHTIILEQPLYKELDFYYRFVSENKTIPVIITDEFNNIQVSQNIDIPPHMKVLVGDLYKQFTKNPPLEYQAYGMILKLYYTESNVYTDLQNVLNDLSNSFLNEVTDNSVFVPVIITDSSRTKVIASGNIPPKNVSPENLASTLSAMQSSNTPIKITLPDNKIAYIFYEKSYILKALQYYPLFFIIISVIIIIIAFQFFNTIKKSEQNSVWVGMSKETAHQLGTPISSLIAWVEYLRLNPENNEMCNEIEKDVKRLETITQRFSKIGSMPELIEQDLIPIINNSIDYLRSRTPKRILFQIIIPQDKAIIIPLNPYLLEWVLENLCKNAIDAMSGSGEFKIELSEDNKKIHIDVSDTGKGISKKCHKKIFQPGFTTKNRGWGLGLSLAKRIIEEYHNGRIFVKQSSIGKGTTFRITFNK